MKFAEIPLLKYMIIWFDDIVKRQADFYSHKAKAHGYPARSVYKLQEILSKYAMLKKGARVLDLGAAPGSFSRYLLERLHGSGSVLAVDLNAGLAIPRGYTNFHFIQGDIFLDSVLQEIKGSGPFDLIVSDAAPATTGNRLVDTTQSLELARRVLFIGLQVLAAGGNLIVKIFQGGEEGKFLREMKACFKQVKGFKPQASRRESFETYYLGFYFKQPAAPYG
jgi:23S rRNA (uridine2552-2'-O)-methyltransferase